MTDMYMDPHLYGEEVPKPAADEANPKDRLGIKKPPLELVPAAGIIHEAMAFKLGAIKYTAYNWRSKKVRAMIYLGAALRHIQSVIDGEDVDPESKGHHLGHARACLGIYLDGMETGNLIDDRPPKGVASELIKRLTEK